MWVNQDKMFADEDDGIAVASSTDANEKAIEVLDRMACRIADGEITVSELTHGVNPRHRGKPATKARLKERRLLLDYTLRPE